MTTDRSSTLTSRSAERWSISPLRGLLAALASLLIALLASLSLYYALQQEGLRADMTRKAEAIAGSLGERLNLALAAGIPLDRLRDLEATLEATSRQDPDVVYVALLDRDGETLAEAGPAEGPRRVVVSLALGSGNNGPRVSKAGETAEPHLIVALEQRSLPLVLAASLPSLLPGSIAAFLALAIAGWIVARRRVATRLAALETQLAQARAETLVPPALGREGASLQGSDEIAAISRELEALRSQVATAHYVFKTWARMIRESHVDDEVKALIDQNAEYASQPLVTARTSAPSAGAGGIHTDRSTRAA